MSMRMTVSLVLVFVALLLGSMSLFTVMQWETGIVVRIGKITRTDVQPGLHWLIPFVEKALTFDRRIMTQAMQDERFLTAEKKNVIVDAFIQWHIEDVKRFYTATRRGDFGIASVRLTEVVEDGLRGQFGKRTIQEVVSGERTEIMEQVTKRANKKAFEDLGITIVDVRIKRIDLPEDVSGSVYERMKSERARVAAEFRARGKASAKQIMADANLTHDTILADAQRDALTTRGKGDATAAETYAKAYTADREFFSFYRSLDAYKKTFATGNDILILEPDSEFFRFFANATGKQRAQ